MQTQIAYIILLLLYIQYIHFGIGILNALQIRGAGYGETAGDIFQTPLLV